MYQGVRNVCFSENFACFNFLLPPFWDSLFCLITDHLWEHFLDRSPKNCLRMDTLGNGSGGISPSYSPSKLLCNLMYVLMELRIWPLIIVWLFVFINLETKSPAYRLKFTNGVFPSNVTDPVTSLSNHQGNIYLPMEWYLYHNLGSNNMFPFHGVHLDALWYMISHQFYQNFLKLPQI